MFGGGSRRSIAIGALIGLFLILPQGVRATTPKTLSLSVTPTTTFTDLPVTVSVTMTPAVAGLEVLILDPAASLSYLGFTDALGVVSMTFTPAASLFHAGPHFIHATSDADATYGAATSNTVELDLLLRTTSITMSYNSIRGDTTINTVDELDLHVRLPTATCDGWIEIDEATSGFVNAGAAGLISNGNGTSSCGLDIYLGPQAKGTLQFTASYTLSWRYQDTASSPLDVPVTLIATNTTLTDGFNQVELGSTTFLDASVSALVDNNFVIGQGTITFFDGATVIGSGPAQNLGGGVGRTVIQVSFNALGTHTIHATWSGTAQASSSTSPTFALTVTADTVLASGLGIGATTFYPILDGYRDTVSIIGTLLEPASDTILIKTTTGVLVGEIYVPSGHVGQYSVNWNGRRSAAPVGRHAPPGSGAIVPAGTYRITQILTDNLGAHLSVTNPVTVSWKKLVWYTGSKTLYGNQYTVKGGNGGIAITSGGAYYRGERLYDPGSTPGYYAALGYQFTLPAATSYSSISFAVLGSGTSSPYIGLQDHRLGTWPTGSPWIIDYFSPIVGVTTRYQWSTVVGDATYNRIGTTVRGMVLALDWTSGRYDVSQVRLTYRYAFLK